MRIIAAVGHKQNGWRGRETIDKPVDFVQRAEVVGFLAGARLGSRVAEVLVDRIPERGGICSRDIEPWITVTPPVDGLSDGSEQDHRHPSGIVLGENFASEVAVDRIKLQHSFRLKV